MFKKLAIAIAVFATTSSLVLASSPPRYRPDIYRGVDPCPVVSPCCPTLSICGAYVGLSGGLRNNYTGDPTYFRGFEGTLSLGYGALMASTFYLGGEVFVQDTANVSNQTLFGDSARSTWGYGVSVLPGVLVNDLVLGYLRIGAVRTRFNDAGVNKTGGQVGLGLQASLCGNWDLRAEYDWSVYQSIAGQGNPKSDEVTLGIVYKFM